MRLRPGLHLHHLLLGLLLGALFVHFYSRSRPIPVEKIEGTFASCGRGGQSYIVQHSWKNVGNHPVRTVYATIRIVNKDGVTVFSKTDYPIYSVSNAHPGVAPGETYKPRPEEGVVIPFGTSRPDSPHKCFTAITKATEAAID
jgi:hypothetical protein